MGFSLGQGGSPTYYVQGASIAEEQSSLIKVWGGRFTPRGAGAAGDQLVFKLGGFEVHYDDSSGTERIYLVEAKSLVGSEHSTDQAMINGTEYDWVIYQADDGGDEYNLIVRARANSAGLGSAGVLMTVNTPGSGTYTSQTGTPRWGANSASADTVADFRDAFFGTYTNLVAMLADIENFGLGYAPFQFQGVTLKSCPAAIGTEVWDRRIGAAAVMTTSPATTYNVLGITLQDGPIYAVTSDPVASALGTNFTTNLKFRTCADFYITTSANAVVEKPDMSGLMGHCYQLTAANQGEVYTNRWGQIEGINNNTDGRTVTYATRGGSVGGAYAAGNGFTSIYVGGINSNEKSAAAQQNIVYLDTAAGQPSANYLVHQLSTNDANGTYFRISLAGNIPPSNTSPKLVVTTNISVHFASWGGAGGANNCHYFYDGIATDCTQTTSSFTRYMYKLTNANSSGYSLATREREIWCFDADKNSVKAAMCSALNSRHSIPSRLGAIAIVAASSENGASASHGRFYISQSRKMRPYRIGNFSADGAAAWGIRVAMDMGFAGTGLAIGATVTNDLGGTGLFLCEDVAGLQLALYSRSAANWTATSGTLTWSGGSGTFNLRPASSAVDLGTTAINAGKYLSRYSSTRRICYVNIAGNAFTETQNPLCTAELAYRGVLAVFSIVDSNAGAGTRVRRIVRMHQPTQGADGASCATQWAAFLVLLKAAKAAGTIDALVDVSTLPQFNEYSATTDTGDTAEYADGVHTVGGDESSVHGQFRWLGLIDDVKGVVWPEGGGGFVSRTKGRRRITRSRL